MSKPCACGTGKTFDDCCGRFLSGEAQAKTPEQLMRSRYSAYALGGYGEYLLATWFPATAAGLTAAALDEKTSDWDKLEVLDKSQQGDEGMVEFKAWFREGDGVQKLLHEKSVFTRVRGRWLYVGGEVALSQP